MNITVFGASGKSGKFIVAEALKRGHKVTAFVRNPSKMAEFGASLNVVVGDISDPAKVADAVPGADAVISAIGHVAGSKPDMQTEGVRNIIKAMNENNIRRFIDLTGAGVVVPGDHPRILDRLMTKALSIVSPARIRDGINHVAEIQKTNLDWTIVRTPLQLQSPYSGKYHVGMVGDPQLSFKVNRGDIADFILTSIESGKYIHQYPVLG